MDTDDISTKKMRNSSKTTGESAPKITSRKQIRDLGEKAIEQAKTALDELMNEPVQTRKVTLKSLIQENFMTIEELLKKGHSVQKIYSVLRKKIHFNASRKTFVSYLGEVRRARKGQEQPEEPQPAPAQPRQPQSDLRQSGAALHGPSEAGQPQPSTSPTCSECGEKVFLYKRKASPHDLYWQCEKCGAQYEKTNGTLGRQIQAPLHPSSQPQD